MEPRAEPATAREGAKGRRAAAEGVVAARVALGERRGGGGVDLVFEPKHFTRDTSRSGLDPV